VSTAKRLHYDYADYLAALADSHIKLEYRDGVIYAMAGGTPTHAELAATMIALLRPLLPTSCRLFSSDLKVRVEATDLSTFPDVSVVCGPLLPAAGDANAATNPSLLVEVTSRSTEDYDRGDKLAHYKQLPALRAVLFVSHREARVTLVERSDTGWEERESRAGERVELHEPQLSFPVDDLYRGVALEPV
jgi:Uma2 family endonuclease